MLEIFFTFLTLSLIGNFLYNVYALFKFFRREVEIEKWILGHISFFTLFMMFLIYSIYYHQTLYVISLLRFFSYILVLDVLFLFFEIMLAIRYRFE